MRLNGKGYEGLAGQPIGGVPTADGMVSGELKGIAEELSTAIGTLPDRAIASGLKTADCDPAAIQGVFQFRKKDGHTAQKKCDFVGSAPWTVGRFSAGSHFHRGVDADVICFLR